MPNKIEDFVAWKAYWHVLRTLAEIRRARGYNTDPLVSDDYETARTSKAKYTVFMMVDGHSSEESLIGDGLGSPGTWQAISFWISGNVELDAKDNARREAFALEQDVRNALASACTDLRESVGRGFVVRWGDCLHYLAETAPDRQATFTLRVVLRYSTSSTW